MCAASTPLTSPEKEAIVATAHRLADAARAAILPYFRAQNLGADNKLAGGFDPVTAADRASEDDMRRLLAELRPDDAILGEEFGARAGSSGLTWILDPIDGTRGFLTGTPTWGVLIAVADATGPIYGIIDQPYTGERFEGGFGRAQLSAVQGDRALQTRAARPLAEAFLYSTYPEVGGAEDQPGFERVKARARLTRFGMDCYAYALLAAGQIDLVIEAGLQSYDIAAPIAVIRAAGGVVTNWEGGDCAQGGRVLAAANPQIHAEAMALLRG